MLLYRILFCLVASVFLILAIIMRKMSLAELKQRLCYDIAPPRKRPSAPNMPTRLWIHGASNGEILGAKALILDILNRSENLEIILTANTKTAIEMIKAWENDRIIARLASLDYHSAVSRFYHAYTPKAVLFIENEVWPVRFHFLRKRQCPIFMISARISEKSAQRWLGLPRFLSAPFRQSIAAVTYLASQDIASEERYCLLGLDPQKTLARINLKSSVKLQKADALELERLQTFFKEDTTFLAVSTHAQEEKIILDAFSKVTQEFPDCKLILAPRHPKRRLEIANILEKETFRFAFRTQQNLTQETNVYIADTLGETQLWYALSRICFVGGSLSQNGGHTPFEPAQFKCAILHGPHISNHEEAYSLLQKNAASVTVLGSDHLAQVVLKKLRSPDMTKQKGENAFATLETLKTTNATHHDLIAKLSKSLDLGDLSA